MLVKRLRVMISLPKSSFDDMTRIAKLLGYKSLNAYAESVLANDLYFMDDKLDEAQREEYEAEGAK
jgi:hypothetical protein